MTKDNIAAFLGLGLFLMFLGFVAGVSLSPRSTDVMSEKEFLLYKSFYKCTRTYGLKEDNES